MGEAARNVFEDLHDQLERQGVQLPWVAEDAGATATTGQVELDYASVDTAATAL